MQFSMLKRTWAEINLDHLCHNYKVIRERVKDGAKIMAVVKADAYGHGDRYVSRTLEECGADFFAVSNIEEALSLRKNEITKPILIFGITPTKYVLELSELNITQTVFSKEYAMALNDSAKKAGVVIECHLKLDSGMSRIGFMCDSESDFEDALKCYSLSNLKFTGVFTHFAVSDESSHQAREFTKGQFEKFKGFVDKLKSCGCDVGLVHCCNSAGVLSYPEFHLDMVRPGVILYGLSPSDECVFKDLLPVMELKSVVSMVKKVPADTPVSYGRTFVTPRETTLATVCIGYADGYPRALSNRGEVLIRSKRAKILGRVCMDQIIVDVTGIDGVCEGDVVTLFGRDNNEFIGADELAKIDSTISYELICLIGKRVPRLYLKDNKPIDVVDIYFNS